MKSTNLPVILALALCTALFASCSKNDAVVKKEAAAAEKSNKLKTMDDDCTKTETYASTSDDYSFPDCGDGGDYGYTLTETIHGIVTDGCTGETTYPTYHQTIFSRGCSTPAESPLPYPLPTAPTGGGPISPTLDFSEENIEYFNNSFLTSNPSILQALREVQNNTAINSEADNVDVDDKPGDPYVREQIYWAMFGVVLVQQIGITDATTLANNTNNSYFYGNGVPGALAKRAAFATYMSTDMPSGGLPELRAWLENRMQQGSF